MVKDRGARPDGSKQSRFRLDATGAVLLSVLVFWLALRGGFSAEGSGSAPLLLSCAAILVVARLAGRWSGRVVPAGVVLLGLLWVGTSGGEVFGGAPLAGPLGYSNANAAFYVQAAVAALLLAVTPELRFRIPWILTASVFALVPILNGSRAALLSLAFLVPGSVVVQRSGGVRAAAVFCGATWLLVLSATFVLGLSYDANGAPGLAHRLAAQGLSERRLALWHDALSIARQHPITGAGPGSFALESPVATADPDAAFAHNEYLEQAAETGIPALLLLMCLFAWGLVRLSVARGPNRSKALALAGWSAMGVHASVDYILHFAVIPMVAVALIGSTMASRSSPKSLD